MEEMRQAIERGRGIVPRSASPLLNSTLDMDRLRNLVADAEYDIKRAHQSHQEMQAELKLVTADVMDVSCFQPMSTCAQSNVPSSLSEGF
jgi:hypothetical protein